MSSLQLLVGELMESEGNKSVGYLRTKLWREANPDRYREYQRNLMRARRARQKQAEAEGPSSLRDAEEGK